ncbi:MAG: methylated-DNA--[Oscillospiraceae bacterium]|nr:methylated-DNA--[protein]-cysteine S-methyltransferase [Oscillospiraceae bacterium]
MQDCTVRSCASPLGSVTLAARDGALVGLWFQGQAYFGRPGKAGAEPEILFPDARASCAGDAAVLDRAVAWLERYFRGEDPGTPPPCAPGGTAFQRAVWARLAEIPYGETVSYGALAAELGSSARAVGGAVGRNPISLMIPCHRVLGADGSLTGYAGGTERKRWLLELERTADKSMKL